MNPSGHASYDAIVTAYLADCARRSVRPATVRYYAMVLSRFGATGIESMDELTVSRVRDFQDRSHHLAAGSVRGFVRPLKTFGRWAYDEGLLPADPLVRLRLPRADRRVVTVPSDDELIAVLGAAAPRLRAVLLVIVGTGLHISDVCALDVADLRPSELRVTTTKKNRAGQLVPLNPVLDGALRSYLADVRTGTGNVWGRLN